MKETNVNNNESIMNLFAVAFSYLIGSFIVDNLINTIRPLTKKEMKSRINFLESELITKYAKCNEEIIVP